LDHEDRAISVARSACAGRHDDGKSPAFAQQQPNILVIMADDIGYWNISAYNRGMMGYRTPNIDRIANEGAIFTDYYGQQSCTAGRHEERLEAHLCVRVERPQTFPRG
jgi:Sulfatase